MCPAHQQPKHERPVFHHPFSATPGANTNRQPPQGVKAVLEAIVEEPERITAHPQFFTATCLEWKSLLKPDKYKDMIIDSLCFFGKGNPCDRLRLCDSAEPHSFNLANAPRARKAKRAKGCSEIHRPKHQGGPEEKSSAGAGRFSGECQRQNLPVLGAQPAVH